MILRYYHVFYFLKRRRICFAVENRLLYATEDFSCYPRTLRLTVPCQKFPTLPAIFVISRFNLPTHQL